MAVVTLNRVTFEKNIEAQNPRKTETCLDLGAIDISTIEKDILDISDQQWESEHRNSPNYNQDGVLKHTRQITFKFSSKKRLPFSYFETPIWSDWQGRLLPIMEEAVKFYDYEDVCFPRVMFAKLPAGRGIDSHTDGGVLRSRPHKIHIPISTNEKCFFLHPPDTKYHLRVGRVYEVNNCRTHGAENGGKSDRIHFIFECMPLGTSAA